MGQMEMKIFNIGKNIYIGQGYSGERCGPWTSFFAFRMFDRLMGNYKNQFSRLFEIL
jgi:hypothetical protein